MVIFFCEIFFVFLFIKLLLQTSETRLQVFWFSWNRGPKNGLLPLLLIFDVCGNVFLVLKRWQHQSSSRITMMAIIKAKMKIYITYNVIIYLHNSSISIYFYMPSQQQALDSLNYFERVFRTITNLLGYSVSLFCFILFNPIYMIVWLSPFSCTSS